jgi:hypothetical protein
MSLSNIANLTLESQTITVYEYAFTVTNTEDSDTQELTTAFTSIPTLLDWQQKLAGWKSCGYELSCTPILINTFV